MIHPVAKKLTMALLIAAFVAYSAGEANAQRRYGKTPPRGYRHAQFEQNKSPTGDSRVQKAQAESFPMMDDIIPPSLDGAPNDFIEPIPYQESAVESGSRSGGPQVEFSQDMGMISTGSDHLMQYDNVVCDDAAPVYSTGTWFRRGHWYTEMEALLLTHDRHRDSSGQVINAAGQVAFISDPVSQQVFSANDLAMHDYATGARIKLGRFLGRDTAGSDHMVEGVYMGGFDWSAGQTVRATTPGTLDANILTNTDPDPDRAVFQNANSMTFNYETSFNSLEMNYRIATRPGRDQVAMQPDGNWVRHGVGSSLRSVIAGFRGLSWHETASLASQQSADRFGLYSVQTHNDMFGLQLGGELREKSDEFTWGLSGKLGGLLNIADRQDTLDSGSSPGALDLSVDNTDDNQRLAFLAELGLNGSYQVRPNLHFTAGYNFILISGLSIAPEQMNLRNSFDRINTGATKFLHGGGIGFETTW